ncbi:MAG TPA: NmrA family NAD(P)-binding protein, partial [Candidatus Nanopelagicales bacterium]
LLEAGQAVRAADIDPLAIPERLAPEVAAVRFDFTDAATWPAAFRGVDVMFLMRPPQLSNIARDMVPALEAARAAGVGHIVLLSLQGAEHARVVPHAKIEAWLRDSGLAWTFVRPSFFMENLSTTHAPDIRDRDAIIVPAGSGRTAFVAASDIAEVAAAALLDPAAHRNRAWTPTGPEALTYDEVAAILTDTLGRPIRYAHPGVLRYLPHAIRELGMPPAMALVTTAIYTVARLGKAAGLTDDVRTVTGHGPVALTDWAKEHRAAWERRG